MKASCAYRHIEAHLGSPDSKEVHRTGFMAMLQDRDRARERKLAVTRVKKARHSAVGGRRRSVSAPMLSANHPLSKARSDAEAAISTYQALVHLENADHHHHRSMPIPRILSGEANSYATLANVLRMLSTLCEERSTHSTLYLSDRGETSVELFEMATQMCDVAMGIAGSIGSHEVEAFALKSLSDLAFARHVYDVARSRQDRAIAMVKLMPAHDRQANGGRGNRLLAVMIDSKHERAKGDVNRAAHLERLRSEMGIAAMKEEAKVTAAFLEVVRNREKHRTKIFKGVEHLEGATGAEEKTDKELKNELLDSTEFLEWSELMGCYPPLNGIEATEAMAQICAGADAADIKKGWNKLVGLEPLVVWWLEVGVV